MMHTRQDSRNADNQSACPQSDDIEVKNALYHAYGLKVKELLSQSDAEDWIEDLWDMYTGFTLFSQEAGYDPRGHNRFVSFKELVFFFRDVGKCLSDQPWLYCNNRLVHQAINP